jgi:hypothetical protein
MRFYDDLAHNKMSFKNTILENLRMKIKSPAFNHNEKIPKTFTSDGRDINPELRLGDIPDEAQSLVLIVDDPDAPGGMFVHWVVYDIPVVTRIDENSIPGKQGKNDFGEQNYRGPSPPSGIHRYFFKIYALDKDVNYDGGMTKEEILQNMEGHILDQAELIGLYEKY